MFVLAAAEEAFEQAGFYRVAVNCLFITDSACSGAFDENEVVAVRVTHSEHGRHCGPHPHDFCVRIDAVCAQVRMVGVGVPGRKTDA
ncbi:hypothetical protein ACFQ51_51865 [Streptomyces kaempferi]